MAGISVGKLKYQFSLDVMQGGSVVTICADFFFSQVELMLPHFALMVSQLVLILSQFVLMLSEIVPIFVMYNWSNSIVIRTLWLGIASLL